MSKQYKWYKITENENLLQWQSNNMCIAEANSKKITLAKHNNTILAFAYKCPHAGGILADGFLDALGNVVCPLHRYKFSINNGRNISGEGYYLKTFPIEIRDDGIYVGFAEEGFFSFLQ
ncbi:MAG: Rieske 2Fe-2S domain-containing protein [Bacteroidetes bacterium]|nr:Rieske 2Fe-2S domain-containing protein [Bacteroidota bacterium]MBS1591870.1 Rieske 2Fe-2S domain-containing protein [Bacteroidota bacterium]